MLSVTMQMMKKNMRMLIPAGIAILIGTAFITATLLFTNALNISLVDRTTGQYGQSNYAVSLDDATLRSDGEVPSLAGAEAKRIGEIDGVESARLDVNTNIMLTGGDTHASGYGILGAEDGRTLPVEASQGRLPSSMTDDEIAIPAKTADQLNAHVGDTVTVRSTYADSPVDVTARIVGLTTDPHNVYGYYGGGSVLSPALMTKLLSDPSYDDLHGYGAFLYVDPADASTVAGKVKAQLPEHYQLMTREQLNERAIRQLSDSGGDVTKQFLLAFGVLAMVVAALVIANTFQVLVAQRRKTLALLRTIGATKRQLYVSVLEEAGMLGFVASALGVGAGIGLMAVAAQTTRHLDNGLGTLTLDVTWQSVVYPIVFGIVVTVLASVGSARAATNVTPLEAMRPIELSENRRSRKGRAVFGLLLLAGGIAAMVASIPMAAQSSDSASQMALLLAVLGCGLVFIGLALTAIFWMPKLMKAAGSFVALFGPSAKLANANIQKNPRRISATGTALLIGVTLISTLATGAAAAKATMNEALDTRYSVDIVVTGDDLAQSDTRKAAAEQGIAASLEAPTAMAVFTDGNGNKVSTQVIGIPDVASLQRVFNMKLDNPVPTLGDGDVILPDANIQTGKSFGIKDGSVEMTGYTVPEGSSGDGEPDGDVIYGEPVTLHAEQYDFHRVSQGAEAVAFVNRALFENGTFTQTGDIAMFKVKIEQGQSLSNVVEAIQKDYAGSPTAVFTGPVAERSQWESMVNMMLMLLVALLAVAVVIAVIGVANTLSLSVIERTRESATLRAIGMTKGQLKRSLAIEAMLISVVTSIVGMVVGTLFGWLGIYIVMSSIAKVAFVVDWGTYGIILAVAVLCALLASVFPARRAVKTPPVEALAEA
ncbi:ABC transporter permease [Bifidobacterium criceti]|uniref:Peptide ABC transporter permease n=1 Tax=Bifidobacterium criceti TaxID=1960969 RepID=A0A2A2EDS7_9BIFI|nr:FtsX-like permease family protein [Bifidobacterium criceti]PAU67127.1 peptide ABC transporter permease [Bifidobacterium criceti]